MPKIIIPFIIGICSGLLSVTFLKTLDYVTSFRNSYYYIILLFPFFGLLKKYFGAGLFGMMRQERVSPWLALRMFVSSIGTHLFGGSAGREGVGVIMGGAISQIFNDRSWLYVGMSAGFSSIFGTPLAGTIFVIELFKQKDKWTIFYMMISSIIAHVVSKQFITHFTFSIPIDWNATLLFYLILGIFSISLLGNFFYYALKSVKRFDKYIFVISALYVLAVFISNWFPYLGINTDLLAMAFNQEAELYDVMVKFILTVVTLGVGFKGGEVTPLFILGSSSLNIVCSFFGFKNYALSSALGMVGLFGAVTHTPIAAGVMAYELFGPEIGILSLVVTLGARFLMGKRSVYKIF